MKFQEILTTLDDSIEVKQPTSTNTLSLPFMPETMPPKPGTKERFHAFLSLAI